jgi:ribosomal silencing factor RsfS
MSFTPPFTYVSAEQVAKLVRESKAEDVQVVDVRDDDFKGG